MNEQTLIDDLGFTPEQIQLMKDADISPLIREKGVSVSTVPSFAITGRAQTVLTRHTLAHWIDWKMKGNADITVGRKGEWSNEFAWRLAECTDHILSSNFNGERLDRIMPTLDSVIVSLAWMTPKGMVGTPESILNRWHVLEYIKDRMKDFEPKIRHAGNWIDPHEASIQMLGILLENMAIKETEDGGLHTWMSVIIPTSSPFFASIGRDLPSLAEALKVSSEVYERRLKEGATRGPLVAESGVTLDRLANTPIVSMKASGAMPTTRYTALEK